MPQYRRARIAGGTFFFTVAIADRRDDLLVREVDRLRRIYSSVQSRHPFETVAICILTDHLHAIWTLPENDDDFPQRWSLIKSGFSVVGYRRSSLADVTPPKIRGTTL